MEVINKNEFQNKIGQDKLVLIDFFATWCMPCKMMAPILEELKQKYENKIEIYKVDVDESEDLAREYDIYSVPSMILYKNGKKLDMVIGYNNLEKMSEFVSRQL